MKKAILVLVSLVLMLATQFALADEEFTLHNGTKFGMTIDEATEIESSKGFSLTSDPKFNQLSGRGTIAAQADTGICYFFGDNNSLYRMDYEFSDINCFYDIEKNLIAKYGETEYSSDTLKEYPTIYTYSFGQPVPMSSYSLGYANVNRDSYSQRVIKINDKYVLIDHYVSLWKGVSTGKVSTKLHTLDYLLLSDDEANIILNNSNPSNDDL